MAARPPLTESWRFRRSARQAVLLGTALLALAGGWGESQAAEPGHPEGLERLWEVDLGRTLGRSLALPAGSVAATTLDRGCVLLDRSTGALIWKIRLGAGVQGGVNAGPEVLVGVTDGRDAHIFCLDWARGTVRWRQPLGEAWGAPLVREDRVYAASLTGRILALRLQDGVQVWEQQSAGTVRASLALTDTLLLVSTAEDSLLALRLEDGRRAWSVSCGGGLYGPPPVDGGRLWCVTYSGRVLALDAGTGASRGERQLPGYFRNGLAHGAHLYALSTSGHLFALDPATLATVWNRDFETAADLPCTPADGLVWIGLRDGSVHAMKEESGEPVWELSVRAPVAAPIEVEGDAIFLVGGKGLIAAYRRAESPAGARAVTPSGAVLRSEGASRGLPAAVAVEFAKHLQFGEPVAAAMHAPVMLRTPPPGASCGRAEGTPVFRLARPLGHGIAILSAAGSVTEDRAGVGVASMKQGPASVLVAGGSSSGAVASGKDEGRGGGLGRWLYTIGWAVGTGAALWLQAEADDAHDRYRSMGEPDEREEAFDRAEALDRAVVGTWVTSEIFFVLGARAWLKTVRSSVSQ
jgi:outer membrane protein assembly factor BamB